MKLRALHIISGVEVVKGKGKGSNTAQPDDIFTSPSAQRLIDEGAAVEYVEPESDDDVPEEPKKAAEPKKAGKAGKKAAAAPVVDDLDLGDDDGKDDVIE